MAPSVMRSSLTQGTLYLIIIVQLNPHIAACLITTPWPLMYTGHPQPTFHNIVHATYSWSKLNRERRNRQLGIHTNAMPLTDFYKLFALNYYLSVPYNFVRYRKVSSEKFVLQVEPLKFESLRKQRCTLTIYWVKWQTNIAMSALWYGLSIVYD